MKWTEEQKMLLFSPVKNEAIAEATGRSLDCVKRMRLYHTGHTTDSSAWRALKREKMKEVEGTAHVIATAKRIGAKILDVD